MPAFDVVVMREEEILAEKVRAIFTRSRARDIHDVFFLIQKGIKPNLKLINEKLNYYSLSFSYLDFIKRLNESEKIWKSELAQLVRTVPPFEKVTERISSEFKELIL